MEIHRLQADGPLRFRKGIRHPMHKILFLRRGGHARRLPPDLVHRMQGDAVAHRQVAVVRLAIGLRRLQAGDPRLQIPQDPGRFLAPGGLRQAAVFLLQAEDLRRQLREAR